MRNPNRLAPLAALALSLLALTVALGRPTSTPPAISPAIDLDADLAAIAARQRATDERIARVSVKIDALYELAQRLDQRTREGR